MASKVMTKNYISNDRKIVLKGIPDETTVQELSRFLRSFQFVTKVIIGQIHIVKPRLDIKVENLYLMAFVELESDEARESLMNAFNRARGTHFGIMFTNEKGISSMIRFEYCYDSNSKVGINNTDLNDLNKAEIHLPNNHFTNTIATNTSELVGEIEESVLEADCKIQELVLPLLEDDVELIKQLSYEKLKIEKQCDYVKILEQKLENCFPRLFVSQLELFNLQNETDETENILAMKNLQLQKAKEDFKVLKRDFEELAYH